MKKTTGYKNKKLTQNINKTYTLIRSLTLRASFTKQGKLVRERKSKTAPMGGEIYAGDLLTMHKLKNTDATSYFHHD